MRKELLFSHTTLIFILLSMAVFVMGQGTNGTIEGSVKDSNETNIPGATITVENDENTSGFIRSTIADEKGFFIITEIPPGIYRVAIKGNGFETSRYTIEVLIDQTTKIKSILDPDGASDTGFPETQKQTIDVSDSGVQTDITRELAEKLPRTTRFGSLLKISPEVREEPLNARFQINGASGAENTYFIDGLEVTNFRTGLLNANNELPFELIREVQVRSNGIQAQYNGSWGGVVSVATVGGNNSWQGEFGISFAPEKFKGKPNVFLNRFGSGAGQFEFFQPPKDSGTDIFPTARISGPVLSEKVWFLAAYTPQIDHTTRSIDYFVNGPNPNNRLIGNTIEYNNTVRTDFAYLRIDAQPSENLRMFGSFLYNPLIQDGTLPANYEGLSGFPQGANNLSGAEFLATRGGRQNSNLVNGQISWTPTDNLYLSFRAGKTFLNEKLDTYGIPRQTRYLCSSSGSPENFPGSNCSRGFQNISNNYKRDYDATDRTTFDIDAGLYGINALGRHFFRFGYQYNHLKNVISEGYIDTGFVVLYYGIPITSLIGLPSTTGNIGSGFLQRFGRIGDASNNNQSFYGQDSWVINKRLTLNLGIRFENEDIPDYADNLNINFGWKDKISPRAGFALDVLGNGKTKVFGNYGWYYDRLKFDLSRRFTDSFYRDYFEILPVRGADYINYTLPRILGNNQDNPNGQCPIGNSTGWSVCQFSFIVTSNLPPMGGFSIPIIDPFIQSPRQTEYTFGVSHEIGNRFLLQGRYIHREIDRAIEDIGSFNEQGSEFYFLANPGFGILCNGLVDENLPCPKADRKYDALTLEFGKNSNRYFMNLDYTYSRLEGNYSGLASSDEFGRAAPNITRSFDLPSLGFDAKGNPDNGRLATDRPHIFKAYGGYIFDWNDNTINRTTISAYTTIQSGTPVTTIYSLYNVTSSILFGRGDLGRTETFSETDLFVGHRYKFGSDYKFSIEPFIHILNLFDQRNELTRQTRISTTNFTANILTANGCTTCGNSQNQVYYTLFRQGGIQQYILNYLNAQGTGNTGYRNDYNQPFLFQTPRNLRFGLRFKF